MSDGEKSDKLKELEKRRADRKATAAAARDAQREIDLAALELLEIELGVESVAVLEVGGFVPGLPTFIVVKSPGGAECSFYRRYKDMVRKANKNTQMIGAAQDMLGESCIVYPSDDAVRKATFEAFPGAVVSAYVRSLKFVEMEDAEEKKD